MPERTSSPVTAAPLYQHQPPPPRVPALSRRLAPLNAAFTIMGMFAVSQAQAKTYSYTGGGTGTAGSPVSGNFSNGFDSTVTGVKSADTLSFAGTSYSATDDLSSGLTMNALTFGNTGQVSLLRVSGMKNQLILSGTSGTMAAIHLNNTGAVTINLDLSLSSNTTFTGTGAAMITGVISGAGGLNIGPTDMSFSGLVTLTGANTYTGSTIVNGGTLALGADGGGNENGGSLGTGTLTLNNSQLRLGGAGAGNPTAAFTISNAITLNNGTIFSTSGIQHLTGGLLVNGGTLMQQYAGQDILIEGVVSGTGPLTVDSLSTGSGGVHFSQQNNLYTGVLNINGASAANGTSGGYVSVDDLNALQGATVNTDGTMRGLLLNAGPGTYTFGALEGTGSFSVGSGSTLSVGGNGTDTQYSGSLSGAGALIKIGAGTMTVTGVNTYSGGTTISQGLLNVSSDNSLGASGTVINFAGGTLQTGTSGISSSRAITVDASGGTLDTNGNNSTLSGTVSDAEGAKGTFTKTGAGTLTLSGSNSYSGGTTVTQGTLSGSAGSYGGGAITVSSGATVDYTQSSGTTGTAGNNITGQGRVTFGNNTGLGGGTAGTVNYTGTDALNTTVQSGTLALANPSKAALTGPVTIATGATLQLAGGSVSPYQIATTSALTLAGGTFKTNGFSDGSLGGNNKPISGMGGLTLTNGAASTIDFSGGTSFLAFSGAVGSWNGTLNVINYVGGMNHLYVGTSAGLTPSQLSMINFNGSRAIQLSNGELTSPEPSGLVSSLLGACGLAGLVFLRRRRAGAGN